ncbi:MAG: DUF2080 family transposase-associated protein [Candidatus Altiarchaeales archaeon]|nr:DUF2080 family transposase-associated protein [Candidatus Altiarchaeota archaeon]MCG2782626.1 DUF2080 family transposase-associated protein [Candidatus Altiarchaeales archaeon]MBU4266830.1 DUF2080 family transposase-associated protein [Candidatus Altiarchaeota archaeon]MBU4342237.1 DUF2080 family transposase-associated protein [Candidatus Altiarchaeota archaeon]MBU4406799.1 DUF2080 family transposase-associated protein [Candidatus Altiarchaeota archaeon]
MDYIKSHEQLVKEVVGRGNSGGIYLPKSWVGQQVIVRPLSINEYVLNSLTPHLEDIAGIYLCGSYARNEQSADSDIDVLILSGNGLKLDKKDGIDYRVINAQDAEDAIKDEPILLYPLIREAVPIMNSRLLEELKKIKPSPGKLSWITETTDTALKMNEARIELGREISSAIYSLIMRARGLYLAHLILAGKKYTNSGFEAFARGQGVREYDALYAIYRAVRDEKPLPKKSVPAATIRKLHSTVLNYNEKIKQEIQNAKAKEKKNKKG